MTDPKTQLAYETNAHAYETRFMDYEPYTRQMLHFQNRFITGTASVLDIGCGPGNNARIITLGHPLRRYVGVDLSPAMVNLARKNAPAASFYIGDIRHLAFTGRFDVIIASFCIVHLETRDTEAMIPAISNLLNPGGYLYLSFMEGRQPGFETTSFSDLELFYNYYSRTEIAGILDRNGLAILETSEVPYEEPDGSFTTDLFLTAQKRSITSR